LGAIIKGGSHCFQWHVIGLRASPYGDAHHSAASSLIDFLHTLLKSPVPSTLCDVLNKTNTLFPATQVRMRYSVTPFHPEEKSGQLSD
jgi:hypothetical protein